MYFILLKKCRSEVYARRHMYQNCKWAEILSLNLAGIRKCKPEPKFDSRSHKLARKSRKLKLQT